MIMNVCRTLTLLEFIIIYHLFINVLLLLLLFS